MNDYEEDASNQVEDDESSSHWKIQCLLVDLKIKYNERDEVRKNHGSFECGEDYIMKINRIDGEIVVLNQEIMELIRKVA
jgi:hypothetical protein